MDQNTSITPWEEPLTLWPATDGEEQVPERTLAESAPWPLAVDPQDETAMMPSGSSAVLPPEMSPPADPLLPTPGFARVRLLFAAVGYNPVNISVGRQRLITGMSYGELSDYTYVEDGFRTFTVSLAKAPRQILVRKTIPLRSEGNLTLALVNTIDGVDLLPISDSLCTNRPGGRACFRVVNLSPNSQSVDVQLTDGRVIYSDLQYKEAGAFKRVRPGRYHFQIFPTRQHLPMPIDEDIETVPRPAVMEEWQDMQAEPPVLSFSLFLRENRVYTVYLIGRQAGSPPLTALLSKEERV